MVRRRVVFNFKRNMVYASKRARAGFTLVEILVALVLIGLLVGALVPAVLNQLGRGDTSRAVEDLASVENAIRAFRVDVRRWPGDHDDLMVLPELANDTALATQPGYTEGLLGNWNGPYLERLTLNEDEELVLPLGGTVLSNFVLLDDHVTIEVVGLSIDQIEDINQAVDAGGDGQTGRIRWSGVTEDTLRFLAVRR